MSKSRVKTKQEYETLLGQEEQKAVPNTTNDAIEYFERLKEEKDAYYNPFERTMSISQIKDTLNVKERARSLEAIKADIAASQVVYFDKTEDNIDYNKIVNEAVSLEHQARAKVIPIGQRPSLEINEPLVNTSPTYEGNSSKLYDNLRGSRPEIKLNTANNSKMQDEFSKVEINERPNSLTEERVKRLFEEDTEINDAKVLENKLDEPSNALPEIAADFTGENQRLLESINKVKEERLESNVQPRKIKRIVKKSIKVDGDQPVLNNVEQPIVEEKEEVQKVNIPQTSEQPKIKKIKKIKAEPSVKPAKKSLDIINTVITIALILIIIALAFVLAKNLEFLK